MIVQDNCTYYALLYLKETRGRLVEVSSMAAKYPTLNHMKGMDFGKLAKSQ